MHQSEPVLYNFDKPALFNNSSALQKPCLLRMQSLPVHDDEDVVKSTTTPLFIKGPISQRRKVSLSNLFANKSASALKVKVHSVRSGRELRPSAPVISSPLIPMVPRVRSRSAPFSEMSPIQETQRETASDSQDNVAISSPTQLSPPLLYPDCVTTVDVRFTLSEPPEDVDQQIDRECEPVAICFVGSSDDSCCSSDSELQGTTTNTIENNKSLVSLLNASTTTTTHNPRTTDDEQPPVFIPYPNRSPRSSAPMALMTSHSPAAGAQGSTPASRPSPCIRRSSDSEISVTPRRIQFSFNIFITVYK